MTGTAMYEAANQSAAMRKAAMYQAAMQASAMRKPVMYDAIMPKTPEQPACVDASSEDASPHRRGWHARLELEFQRSAARTQIAHRQHVGPLLVQRAFYPEQPQADAAGTCNPCHVYIIHPPGGVAGGDELELAVGLGAGSHALLTTPAAGKFYRRGNAGVARVTQVFNVEEAALEWLPQENIYYPDAGVELRTLVELSPGARFMGWEIGCLGLPANRRTLEGGHVRQGFELRQDGRPLLLERLALSDASHSARWGLGGHPALASALFHPAGVRELDLARACVQPICAELWLACTLVDGVLVCRGLAQRTDHLKRAFVQLWRALRPSILGREAVPPRIWNT